MPDTTPPSLEQQLNATQLQLTTLETKLAETERTLEQTRAAQAVTERTRTIERELLAAGATDLETAALLINTRADSPDADLPQLIAQLKERKPHLFRAPAPSAAMSGHTSPTAPITEAATQARQSGDRRALLRYLRLRRETSDQ